VASSSPLLRTLFHAQDQWPRNANNLNPDLMPGYQIDLRSPKLSFQSISVFASCLASSRRSTPPPRSAWGIRVIKLYAAGGPPQYTHFGPALVSPIRLVASAGSRVGRQDIHPRRLRIYLQTARKKSCPLQTSKWPPLGLNSAGVTDLGAAHSSFRIRGGHRRHGTLTNKSHFVPPCAGGPVRLHQTGTAVDQHLGLDATLPYSMNYN